LNSRGPDEKRMHIPLRAMENGVFHVAANTVGNPNNQGLLWPWTGGSQIVSPDGSILAQGSEEVDDMVTANITVSRADAKCTNIVDNIFAWRRPDLYDVLVQPLDTVPAAIMYGPAPSTIDGKSSIAVAMMQLSRYHTRLCTEWCAQRQVKYAAAQHADIGVFPELSFLKMEEVEQDREEAATYSKHILQLMQEAARESDVYIVLTLVEKGDADDFYHTAYLLQGDGEIVSKYRKAHLNRRESQWATAGNAISQVVDTKLGKLSLMIGDEVWIPEVSRVLAVQGAETVLHPCNWDRAEAPHMAAVERTSENRFHLVSVTRLDNQAQVGSQVVYAGEFIGNEPIALMRYPTAQWMRYGVEEQMVIHLSRRQPWCKMMGHHLDVLATRVPGCYGMFVKPQ